MSGRVENIVERGAGRRRTGGVVMLLVALAAEVLFVAFGVPRWWRLWLVVPFGLSAIGFVQARSRTCVAHAAAGTRECEDGSYTRVSDEERAVARRQAVWVIARAAAIAIGLTALAWIL